MRVRPLLIEALGWYGTFAILGAYALLSFGMVDARNLAYQLLNASGALGIIIVSAKKRAYQPVVLNVVWLLIALIALRHLFF